MPTIDDPMDDGLGPDLLDRSGGKAMGGGEGGGGSYLDPSYEDALRILGREQQMPPPWVQHAIMMDDPEAADLARRLTALRNITGARFLPPIASPSAESEPLADEGTAVQAFIAALQERPVDLEKVTPIQERIRQGGPEAAEALEAVVSHPGVQAILNA